MHDAVLDKAKKITGSDRQTAQKIGLQAQFIYDVRRGDKTLPAECIVKLAFLIGEPWPRLLAEMEGAQAKTPQKKDLWLRVAAGAISLSIAVLLAPPAKSAEIAKQPERVTLKVNNGGLPDTLSIMRNYLYPTIHPPSQSTRRGSHLRHPDLPYSPAHSTRPGSGVYSMLSAVILAAAIQVADAGPRLYGWPQECAYSYGLQSASGEFTPEETQRKYENCLRSTRIPNPEAKSMCSTENAAFFPVCRKATRGQVPGAEQ